MRPTALYSTRNALTARTKRYGLALALFGVRRLQLSCGWHHLRGYAASIACLFHRSRRATRWQATCTISRAIIAPSPLGRKVEMAGKERGFRDQHGPMMTRLILAVTPKSPEKWSLNGSGQGCRSTHGTLPPAEMRRETGTSNGLLATPAVFPLDTDGAKLRDATNNKPRRSGACVGCWRGISYCDATSRSSPRTGGERYSIPPWSRPGRSPLACDSRTWSRADERSRRHRWRRYRSACRLPVSADGESCSSS